MSIVVVYQSAQVNGSEWATLPYASIALSLNVLLTLMIIVRLILHTRSMGISGMGGLCKDIITMLIESCALFSVNTLLFIGFWGAHSSAERIFRFTLFMTQVRAFPRPRSSGKLSDVTTDRAGDRSTVGHSTSR